jgi:RHS repeat-associated protein
MSTSHFIPIARRSILPGTFTAPLLSIVAAALFSTPATSPAQCCGDGGSGKGGMPPIESFAQNSRVQLQIFPGQRNQKVEIFNAQTGVRLATVPFGGSSGPVAFGVTAPDTGGAPVVYTTSDAGEDEQGSSGFTRESSGDSARGADKKAKCCDGSYSGSSVVPVRENQPKVGDKNCKKPGDSKPKDTTSGAPDNRPGGSAGNPASPEPPASSSSGGGEGLPAPAPGLFDALLANIKETQGGANVPISVGEHAPPLVFYARNLGAVNLNDPKFRGYFQTDALAKWDTAVTSYGGFRKYERNDGYYSASAGSYINGGVDEGDGFYSMICGEVTGPRWVANLRKINANTWEVQLTEYVIAGDITLGSEGPYMIVMQRNWDPVGQVDYWSPLPPNIRWRFTSTTEPGPTGRKILDVQRIGIDGFDQSSHVRYWQTAEADGTRHTYMEDLSTAVTTEVIDHDTTTPSGDNIVRGRITYTGTGADATHEGWIMQTGPDYLDQPNPGSDSNVTVANFGGSGNTIWKWASNGMWEKKTESGVDGVARRVETLRPWGNATSPQTATPENSHRTVEDFNALPVGEVRTQTVYIAGQEISRTIDATNTAGSSGGSVYSMTDTHVRFPAGPQSAATVSWTQRYSNRISHPGAGRISARLDGAGTYEQFTYRAGNLNISAQGEIEFDAMDASPAREVVCLRTFVDGRMEKDVDLIDAFGRLRWSERYVVVDGIESPPLETIRRSYIGQSTDLEKIERRRAASGTNQSPAWTIEYQLRDATTDPKIDEIDESGVVTTKSNFYNIAVARFNYPQSIVRQAIPAAGGLSAIPEQTTEITYDSAFRVTSFKVKQGATVLEQEDYTYSTDGELQTVTLNNAIATQYIRTNYGLGSRRIWEYRYAPGQDPDVEDYIAETITDWRGELVSSTGPEVVELHRSESIVGVGRIQVTSSLGPAGNPLVSQVIERDGYGRKIGLKASVPNGQWRTRTFDTLGRRTAERINNETVRTWSYGENGLVTESIMPGLDPDRTVERQDRYVREGATIWKSDRKGPDEQQTKLSGFADDNELSVSRARRQDGEWTTITMTLDSATKTVTKTISHSGATNPVVFKYRAGLLVSEQAHGSVSPTLYTYDALDRVINVSENNAHRTTVVGYEPIFGQVNSVVTTGTDGSSQSQTSVYYQPNEASAGLLKSEAIDGQITYYRWTARGELEATWGATSPVKYEYDAAGRLWKMRTYLTEPGNDPTSWPPGNVTEWVYYPGTMALQTKRDATNNGPVYEYDPRGWLSKRTWARTYNGNALFALYVRNRLGELKSIDYSDNTPDLAITRDEKGRATTVSDGTGGWTYTYSEEDLVMREVNGGTGNALVFQRDGAGRRTGYAYWDQSSGAWATWGGWGYEATTGRLNGVSTPEGWISQSYQAGTSRPNSVIAGGIQSTRTYDDLGRVIDSITFSSIPGVNSDPQTERTYAYNANGQRRTMEDENGDVWEYSYNSRNELTGGVKKRGTAVLPRRQFGYSFDAIGNRTQATQGGSQISSRSYNSKNQAFGGSNTSSVDIRGKADAAPTTTLTLNAQPITNRNGMDFAATVSGSNGYYPRWASVNVTETKQGQAPTETTGHVFIPGPLASVLYDADGNLTQDDRWSYTWDAENRLIKQETKWQGASAVAGMPIQRLEYKYDAYSRRVEKKVSTWNTLANSFQLTRITKFAYDGWNVIAEWDSPLSQPTTLNLVRTHHWGLDVVGSLEGTGGVGALVLSRYHQTNGQTTSCVPAFDGNGNVIAMFDSATGKRAAEYEYGPFGELLRSTGPLSSANPFRYSTKYQDDATGLLYFGNRYYSADLGRWIGRDPIGESGGANLYAMVGNNPINAVDVLGLRTETVSERRLWKYFYDQRYAGAPDDPNRATGEGWSFINVTYSFEVPDESDFKSQGIAKIKELLGGFEEGFMEGLNADKVKCCNLFEEFMKFVHDPEGAWEELKGKLTLPSWSQLQDYARQKARQIASDQIEGFQHAVAQGRAIMNGNGGKVTILVGTMAGKAAYDYLKTWITGGLTKLVREGKFGKCLPAKTGPYRGGQHVDMSATKGDKLDSHHMPAKQASPLPHGEGPAIQMDPADHRRTASYGGGPGSPQQAYRDRQKALIDDGRFEEAFEMDVNDLRSKFGNKYDEAIEEATSALPTVVRP